MFIRLKLSKYLTSLMIVHTYQDYAHILEEELRNLV